MQKLLAAIKKFRGIKIKFLTLNASQWDGFGITVLNIEWKWMGKLCTVSNSKALFFFNISINYKKGGKKLIVRAGLLFMYAELYSRVLVPEKDECEICGDLCETTRFYKGDSTPMCEGCYDLNFK